MKTIEDVLEALLINSNADFFLDGDPNVEFKAIHDALKRINMIRNVNKEIVVEWAEGLDVPFTFCEEDKEELISNIENI